MGDNVRAALRRNNLKSKYMQELIELKEYYETLLEKTIQAKPLSMLSGTQSQKSAINERILVFSEFIEKLDLILNNSCVKPLDSRSPEGQGYRSSVAEVGDY